MQKFIYSLVFLISFTSALSQELNEFEKIGIKNLSKAQKSRYMAIKEYLEQEILK